MSTPQIAAPAAQLSVAGEVRAWLARRKITAVTAARRLGWSQPYISRRINGAVPFNVNDLDQLGALLEVEPAEFLRKQTGTRKGCFTRLMLRLHVLGAFA